MRPSVLVVDDSRFVRASLARDLAGRFRVQQAESGERAWELLLLDTSIAGVLSDLGMPGIDGFELLRRVRTSLLPRLRNLPFAVLSGADDPLQRERARALGADRFVVKGGPIDSVAAWLLERLASLHEHLPATEAVDRKVVPQKVVPLQSPEDRHRDVTAPPGWVADPLYAWFENALGRIAVTGEAPAVLVRLHAPGLADLPARLRRGIRSADALHVEGTDTGWLCVPASAALAIRLGVRFGLLAAGRPPAGQLPGCRIEVCLQPVAPARALDALASLQARPRVEPTSIGLAVRTGAGAWGPGWDCMLPWAAARLLVC